MYTIVRLNTGLRRMELNSIPIESEFVKQFEAITPLHLHCCLRGSDPNNISETVIIAIGAFYQGAPVGIALASCYSHTHHVKLHHLAVLPEHRNNQLARRMLTKLQEEAHSEGGRYYTFIYTLEDPLTPALEKVLAACGWKPAQPFILECLYNSFEFNPPWIHIPYQLPAAMEEFSWSALTQAERQQLLDDERRGVIPYQVLPFREEHLIEPLNSLGLRFEGRIIGWIITHRTAPDTIAYHSLYIERSFQFQGPGIKLLIDAMLIQKTTSIKWAIFELPLIQVDPAWVHFVHRRLIPYANTVTHYVQAWR